MNRDGHKDKTFFIGPEVEHTPAYSKKTLFVVGKPSLDQIKLMAKEHGTPHVFMGANHSFNASSGDPYWDTVITSLLDAGLWVTLDYQAHEHETVLKMLNAGIWQSRIFVPLLGIRIPHIETSSPNLTVKIDDIDFKATNPGVWCMHFSEVTDSNRFTDWQDYETDAVIESDDEYDKPTPMPPYVKADPAFRVEVKDLKDLKPAKVVNKDPVDEEAGLNPDASDDFLAGRNDQEAGLDPDSTSQLKSDPNEEETKSILTATNPASAAEAYADGAKTDPLGSSVPIKKSKSTK